MLRHIYRVIILGFIFVASIMYFSRDIKEVVFHIDNTTTMDEATLPFITIKTLEEEMNRLHGYTSNLSANSLREAVTPIDENQTYDVVIDEKDYEIKKLNYEVREFYQNRLVEEGAVSVFEEADNKKTAKIILKSELESEKEYAVKITLITSQSKKIYFYHRVKRYDTSFISEQLDYVKYFHRVIQNKETAEDIIMYLEPDRRADNSTLAYVNIHSSFDLVRWGELNPTVITEVIPSVKEIYDDIATIELDYVISAEIAGTIEEFAVNEFFRVRYTSTRMYLLDYERRMEAFFDPMLASESQNQLKLGISIEDRVPYVSSADAMKLAFVRGRELWFYDLEKNEMTLVFSFRQENTDYFRDIYDQHDIRILDMDAEGNLYFMLYGYMNRGQYEGKVGVVLYQYLRSENRIEELVYVPIDEPYAMLKEHIGDFSYMSAKDVFYFHLYQNLYSFNLITKKLEQLATEVPKEKVIEMEGKGYVVWQEYTDPRISKNICILNLETGEISTISSPTGYQIQLMDKIDSDIVYGFVKEEDIRSSVDGSQLILMSQIEISSIEGQVRKSYSKPNYYIVDLEVNENIVELKRVQKDGANAVTPVEPDYIMNQENKKSPIITVSSRVTDQALTELYLTLPKGFGMQEKPQLKDTVHTVIGEDPTLRLFDTVMGGPYYYPHILGGVEGAYTKAASAIRVANEGIGVVINDQSQIVWERRQRSNKTTLPKFEQMSWTATNSTLERSIELLLTYQGAYVSPGEISRTNQKPMEFLQTTSLYTPVSLTGISLDEALYYVSMGRPVLAMIDRENAVLIYGYDAFNIMVLDPRYSSTRKIGIQDSKVLFENAGNIFVSYLQ